MGITYNAMLTRCKGMTLHRAALRGNALLESSIVLLFPDHCPTGPCTNIVHIHNLSPHLLKCRKCVFIILLIREMVCKCKEAFLVDSIVTLHGLKRLWKL